MESCLPGFIRSLLLAVHTIKRRRREAEERRVRQEEERARRDEQERREHEELKRRTALENAAFAWAHAERLRTFLAAVEAAVAADPGKTTDTDTAFAQWLDWARWYTDQLDPLLPAECVAGRMVETPEGHFPSAGYEDAMRQIGDRVETISRNISALESRLRYGGGW